MMANCIHIQTNRDQLCTNTFAKLKIYKFQVRVDCHCKPNIKRFFVIQ